MANQVFNIALGRMGEWASLIDAGGAQRFDVIPWDSTATDAVIKDLDFISSVEADANTAERTTGGWNRKNLAGADVTFTVNDTNDRVEVDISDQTWTAVTAGAVTDLGVHYDSTGSEADTAEKNGTWHDFAITPDGSDVTAQIAAGPPAGIYTAS